MIVDAHQHFWQIDQGIYNWIGNEISGIRRDYQPEHLAPYLNHLNVDKTILVQAAESLKENELMLEAANNNPFIGGLIAWVDLTSNDCVSVLEYLADKPIIKGIRPVLQGIEDTDWILQDHILENLKHLPQLGLRFDALIQPRHLGVIKVLGEKVPELSIVVDHAAKPVINNGLAPSDLWFDGFRDLATNPKVFCKISGLATEYGAGWAAKTLQPVADHLLDVFSPNRVMWGSDWPVLELNGSYTQWFSCVQELVVSLSDQEQKHVLGETATEFYGIE